MSFTRTFALLVLLLAAMLTFGFGPAAVVSVAWGQDEVREIPDDVVPPSKNGMIGSLRDLVRQSPVFKEAENADSLDAMLLEADTLLTRIKTENREALLQVNRNVPLGSLPNVVLLSISGLQHSDLKLETAPPALAALVRKGVTFHQFSVASPDPAVAWWSLHTGQSSGRWPAAEAVDSTLPFGEETIGRAAWRAGYTPLYSGHWRASKEQNDLPLMHSYDQWFGVVAPTWECPVEPRIVWSQTGRLHLKDPAPGDRPVRLLDLLANDIEHVLPPLQRRPWFLCCDWPLPVDLENRADALQELDHAITRLMARSTAVTGNRNTVYVVVGTDLGGKRPTAPIGLANPQRLLAPLLLVPAQPQRVNDNYTPCAAWDVLPTLCEIMRVQSKVRPPDGISLWPATRGMTLPQDRLLYWRTVEALPAQAVRKGDWWGYVPSGSQQVSLFDVIRDPAGEHDLASDHPEIIQQLIKPARRTP